MSEKSCRTCWNAAGTQRETTRKTVRRLCRKTGLFVIVSDNKHSCAQWQPRPSNAVIARKANADAAHRITADVEGK